MVCLQSSECPRKRGFLCSLPFLLSRQTAAATQLEEKGQELRNGPGLPRFRPPIAKRWAAEISPIGHQDDNYSKRLPLIHRVRVFKVLLHS